MKTLSKILFISFFLILSISNASAQATKVLFVGNSITFANNLPKLIADLAQSRNKEISYSLFAPDAYGISQHSRDPRLLNLIKEGDWDWVIIQEQSQRPEFSQWQLEQDVYPYAAQLSQLIRKYNPNVHLAFFQTMAHRNGDPMNLAVSPELGTYDGAQHRINATYIEMARRNQAMVVPVGYIWSLIRHKSPWVNLYADVAHPNLTGSYLAACIFYSIIFKDSTIGLPFPARVNDQVAMYFHSMIDYIREGKSIDEISVVETPVTIRQQIELTIENTTDHLTYMFLDFEAEILEWLQIQIPNAPLAPEIAKIKADISIKQASIKGLKTWAPIPVSQPMTIPRTTSLVYHLPMPVAESPSL